MGSLYVMEFPQSSNSGSISIEPLVHGAIEDKLLKIQIPGDYDRFIKFMEKYDREKEKYEFFIHNPEVKDMN